MAGGFSAGGLITGLDTNSLIAQLIQLERQPIFRLQDRISALEKQKEAISNLRTSLSALRSSVQDFRFGLDFNQFGVASSTESVATGLASGPNPSSGAYAIDVLQLASATVATSSSRIGAAINPNAALASSGVNHDVTSGTFTINGTEFNFDFSASSLNDALNAINGAGIGVTATYDALTDKVTVSNSTPGNTSIINFGASTDTSNFLDIINVSGATQTTNVDGATEVSSSVGLGRINEGTTLNAQAYANGGLAGGSFRINGVEITVDPTTDALSDVISRINASGAGVTASYDPTTDGLRVVSNKLGSRTVSFTSGTSNFLDIVNLTTATQTAGKDSQFTVNGGPVLTRNSNKITDVIGDITLNLTSLGTTTLTISPDEEPAIESIKAFVEKFNESIKEIIDLVAEDGVLDGDSTIRSIKSYLSQNIFQQVPGLSGSFDSLLQIGISTGKDFDAKAPFQLVLDETELRAALLADPENVEKLFANDAENGIADIIFDYLDEITGTSGFLNERARSGGSITSQIDSLRSRIDRMEERVAIKEARLRAQFTRMETLVSDFQSQSSSLLSLGGSVRGF